MEAYWAALEGVVGLSTFVRGLLAAFVGLATWLVGLVVLHWLYERYVTESEGADED